MSDATLHAVEDALRAHINDAFSDPDHPRHGKGDVIIDWVAGVTVSNIVDVDGKEIVAYANRLVAPEGNPNSQLGLTVWMAEDISDIFRVDDEGDG